MAYKLKTGGETKPNKKVEKYFGDLTKYNSDNPEEIVLNYKKLLAAFDKYSRTKIADKTTVNVGKDMNLVEPTKIKNALEEKMRVMKIGEEFPDVYKKSLDTNQKNNWKYKLKSDLTPRDRQSRIKTSDDYAQGGTVYVGTSTHDIDEAQRLSTTGNAMDYGSSMTTGAMSGAQAGLATGNPYAIAGGAIIGAGLGALQVSERKKQEDKRINEARKKRIRMNMDAGVKAAHEGEMINARINRTTGAVTHEGMAMKKGGTIKGPGTTTSDSIDAKLDVGDVVVPAKKVPEALEMRKKYKVPSGGNYKLGKGGQVDVDLSDKEHIITKKEVEKMMANGATKEEFNSLYPEADGSKKMNRGGVASSYMDNPYTLNLVDDFDNSSLPRPAGSNYMNPPAEYNMYLMDDTDTSTIPGTSPGKPMKPKGRFRMGMDKAVDSGYIEGAFALGQMAMGTAGILGMGDREPYQMDPAVQERLRVLRERENVGLEPAEKAYMERNIRDNAADLVATAANNSGGNSMKLMAGQKLAKNYEDRAKLQLEAQNENIKRINRNESNAMLRLAHEEYRYKEGDRLSRFDRNMDSYVDLLNAGTENAMNYGDYIRHKKELAKLNAK